MIEFAPSLLVLAFFLALAPLLPLQRTWARSLTVLVCVGVSARYSIWRWTHTLPSGLATLEQLWMWVVFAIEIAAYASLATLLLVLTRRADRSPEADRHEARLRATPTGELPHVDILIPTYNEELEVLRRTILGATNLDYPKYTVYVLDDGRREWLRAYCRDHGVEYVTRPKNVHAKAGNLNHGLTHARGEFFAVLDADFVPHRNFLFRTLGFFEDPRVGVVQTPQYFFNPDPIQHNLGLNGDWVDEQRLTFEDIQPSRDAWDCAYCCGSCAVLRRSAVDRAGGIPTESVTEDVLTSLVLLRQGFITRYLNEKLTHGLAPESIQAFFVQRSRWCRGGLQILFLEQGPLGRGLSWLQKLFFATVGFDWLVQCLIRLLVIAIPLLVIFFGLRPYESVSTEAFVFYQLPVWLSLKGTMFCLAPRRHFPLLTTATWLLTCIRILPTVIATLIRPFGAPFRVTPKGSGISHRSDRSVQATALALIGVFVAALVMNRFPQRALADGDLAGVAGVFCLYNIVLLTLVCCMAHERPRPRGEERFAIDQPCTVTANGASHSAVVVDASLSGALLRLPRRLRIAETALLQFGSLPALTARPVRRRGRHVALQFADMPTEQLEPLVRYLFSGQFDNTIRRGRFFRVLFRTAWRVIAGR